MLKKAIACLLVLAGVCSFHTSAADSKNEQFVNVNDFNKEYFDNDSNDLVKRMNIEFSDIYI